MWATKQAMSLNKCIQEFIIFNSKEKLILYKMLNKYIIMKLKNVIKIQKRKTVKKTRMILVVLRSGIEIYLREVEASVHSRAFFIVSHH